MNLQKIEGRKGFTVNLPFSLWHEFKGYCQTHEATMNGTIVNLVEKYLSKGRKEYGDKRRDKQ